MNLSVNVFQFDILWLDPKGNLSLIRDHFQSLDQSCDLVVLPEMFLSGFCMEPDKAAIKEDGPEIDQLIQLSILYDTAILGSLAIVENGNHYNRVLLITKEGIIDRYDKQYLFSLSGENAVYSIKHDTCLMNFKGWKILPQVCYDLRFPENVRQLPPPDLLVYMANWPTPRIYHWDSLLKARAIENQCYTIGCNRVGSDGNSWEYPGHSVVLQPDGYLASESIANPQVINLEYSKLSQYRSKYRFLDDKKV